MCTVSSISLKRKKNNTSLFLWFLLLNHRSKRHGNVALNLASCCDKNEVSLKRRKEEVSIVCCFTRIAQSPLYREFVVGLDTRPDKHDPIVYWHCWTRCVLCCGLLMMSPPPHKYCNRTPVTSPGLEYRFSSDVHTTVHPHTFFMPIASQPFWRRYSEKSCHCFPRAWSALSPLSEGCAWWCWSVSVSPSPVSHLGDHFKRKLWHDLLGDWRVGCFFLWLILPQYKLFLSSDEFNYEI